MFSLATAARFMRHATTIRSVLQTQPAEQLARRYEAAAFYLHERFRRRER